MANIDINKLARMITEDPDVFVEIDFAPSESLESTDQSGLLLEFDPNRGSEGRATPKAKNISTAKQQGLNFRGKRDDRCASIQDPYEKFKCNLMVRAKGSVARFHHCVPERRPWDGEYFDEEQIADLQRAWDSASWKHDSKDSLNQNKGIPQNPTDQLAKNLHQQEIDLNKRINRYG